MFNAIVEALVERASFDLIWPICRMHSQVSYQRFHLQWGICCWMLFCKVDEIQLKIQRLAWLVSIKSIHITWDTVFWDIPCWRRFLVVCQMEESVTSLYYFLLCLVTLLHDSGCDAILIPVDTFRRSFWYAYFDQIKNQLVS